MLGGAARRRGLALAAAAVLSSVGAGCGNPAVPLELKLSLAQARLKPHDALWYVLELKNLTRQRIFISDKFWHDQRQLARNQEIRLGTFFEITGPDGAPVSADFEAVGWHGEYDFWTNPPYQAPKFMDGAAWLEPRQILKASPSVSIQHQPLSSDEKRRGFPEKSRVWAAALSSSKNQDMWKNWPGWARLPAERPARVPRDARILTGFDFTAPGKYRIRAIFAPLREEWVKAGKTYDLFPKGTKVFRFETPWAEFEVVP